MTQQTEYSFRAKIISGNRVTIPDFIMRQWEINVGDTIYITVKKAIKDIQNVVI